MKVSTFVGMKKLAFCATTMLLLLGCRVEADSDPVLYVFQCEKESNRPYLEAMGHTFVIPDGFQIDEYNDNSLVLMTTSSLLGNSKMEIQSIIIRYGPVEEQFHKNWKSVSSWDQLGLNFAAKTHTEDHAYGAQSYWVAFVGDNQQILIYSLMPVEWRSFLNCMIS